MAKALAMEAHQSRMAREEALEAKAEGAKYRSLCIWSALLTFLYFWTLIVLIALPPTKHPVEWVLLLGAILPAGWWASAIWWSGYRRFGLRFDLTGIGQILWGIFAPMTLPYSLAVASKDGEPVWDYIFWFLLAPVRQDS